MAQKFCTKCGAKLDNNFKFCTKCGAPISNTTGGKIEDIPNKKHSLLVKYSLTALAFLPLLALIVGFAVGLFIPENLGFSAASYLTDLEDEWGQAALVAIIFYSSSIILLIPFIYLTFEQKKLPVRLVLSLIAAVLCLVCSILMINLMGGDIEEEEGFLLLDAMSFVSMGLLLANSVLVFVMMFGKLKRKERLL